MNIRSPKFDRGSDKIATSGGKKGKYESPPLKGSLKKKGEENKSPWGKEGAGRTLFLAGRPCVRSDRSP